MRQPTKPRTRTHALMTVDVAAIARLSHACNGCVGRRQCCCARYDVCVSAFELETIIGVLPAAALYADRLLDDRDYSDLFEEAEEGLFSLETGEDGLCAFAYRSGGGIWCSLHTAAEDLGLAPASVKPRVCTLWPLTFSGPGAGILTVVDDALELPCNKSTHPGSREISPELLGTIASLFGDPARDGVQAAAARGTGRVRVPVQKPGPVR